MEYLTSYSGTFVDVELYFKVVIKDEAVKLTVWEEVMGFELEYDLETLEQVTETLEHLKDTVGKLAEIDKTF